MGANAVLPRSTSHSTGHDSLSQHSPVFTLEDGDNLTAHCIGLAGEQDTELLASIRSIIVNEDNAVGVDVMQVFPGDSVAGEPPVHFSMVSNKFRPQDDMGIGMASDVIEGLAGTNGDRLVALYFEHVHPVNCLVSKNRFLRAYESNRLSICASLRGAIYGLGAMFWNYDPTYRKLLSLDLYTMFAQAHYSLHRENHAPNLWTLQASLLLIHERPGDNFTMETPRTWLLSAQAVASAQMIGLHRDPKLWNVAPWEKHLRRKLWWATYTCDVWSSICHGNPPHIYLNSFTTAPIEISDFSVDEEIERESQYAMGGICVSDDISVCARFVEYVKLSQVLHDLLNYFYIDPAYKTNAGDTTAREKKLWKINKRLETWRSLRPSCLSDTTTNEGHLASNNGPLHLAYFAAKTLAFRALMWPGNMAAKFDPKSSLRRFFDHAVNSFGEFASFIDSIDSQSLHSFWGAHARSQLVLCSNFLVYLFLMAPTEIQVQATFRLLERAHAALLRLRDLSNTEDAIALLRPSLRRIDTLFTQAARIMDTSAASRSGTSFSTGEMHADE